MRRDALVVGINLYASLKDTPNSKAKNLITPAVDAEKIAQLLEAEQEFRVIRLPESRINGKLQVDPNKSVSADELLEAITKLFLPSEDLDTALLFFAGHGLQKPLGTLKQTLLATSDANPQLKKWNGVLLRDLWEIIEQSTVKEQIIWLDCCYGGELLNFKENEFPNPHNRFLVAASHSSEVAYERFDGKHGVLSEALIEGLDSEEIDHQNWITARTLGAFVDTELKKYYAETKIPQLPQIRIHDQEIRLVKGKGQPNINQQDDKQWQAIILNTLGQVFRKQGGEDNFQLALMYFRESIKLSDQKYLAKAHTDMGKALLAHGNTKQAAEEFRTVFEIDESLRNIVGLDKVLPSLIYTLVQLGEREEAINYCQRALAISPQNPLIVELYDRVYFSKEIVNPNGLKQGNIKFIKKDKQGKLYGFINVDNESDDIYFNQDIINPNCISQLQKDSRVEVEVKQTQKGLCAKTLRILTYEITKIPQSPLISNHGEAIKLIQGRAKPLSQNQSDAKNFQNLRLEPHTINELVKLLRPFLEDERNRRPFLVLALGNDVPMLQHISWGGAVAIFIPDMVCKLADYGEVAPGKQALWALLEYVRSQVGVDVQQRIDNLRPLLDVRS